MKHLEIEVGTILQSAHGWAKVKTIRVIYNDFRQQWETLLDVVGEVEGQRMKDAYPLHGLVKDIDEGNVWVKEQ